MSMALTTMRSELKKLSTTANLDQDIQQAINNMVARGTACRRKFRATMMEEGLVILLQKQLLLAADGPYDVNVRDMQTAFDIMGRKLREIRDDALATQTDVHIIIELCRGRKKLHEASIENDRLSLENVVDEIEAIYIQIATFDSDIEAMEQDAARLEQRAGEMERESRKKKDNGMRGVGISLIGVALAPFTFGLSLGLVAVGATEAAVNFNEESSCRSKAGEMRTKAQTTRSEAKGLSEKNKTSLSWKNILEEQIAILRSKKDQLEEGIGALQRITTSLTVFLREIDHALNVFQVLDTAFKDVLLHSQSFEILQNALRRHPARLAERAQANLRDLQDKWVAMETMLVVNGALT